MNEYMGDIHEYQSRQNLLLAADKFRLRKSPLRHRLS